MDFASHIMERCKGLDVNYFTKWIDREAQVITFPLWTIDGKLCGYQRYDWRADKLKSNNSKGKYYTYRKDSQLTCWGVEFLNINPFAPLYVTEGIWDAISVIGTGRSCVAVLSNNPKGLAQWLSLLPRKKIAICDGDVAGKLLSKCCDGSFTLPEGKDCNDYDSNTLSRILKEERL